MTDNIIVFDLETTGLSRDKDQIIQFAGMKISRATHAIVDQLNLYIQPVGNYTISLGAYFKHFIKPDFLADKPHFSEVADQIIAFFGNDDVLTYNGNSFDIAFLQTELNKVGKSIDFINRGCYDAFLEEKRRHGISLENTYKKYKGKTMEESGLIAHDAFSDIKATYAVFCAQQKEGEYRPETIISEDNVVVPMEFCGETKMCFNIGKYKNVSIDFVAEHDQNYLKWCISDKCSFMQSAKDFLKNYLK